MKFIPFLLSTIALLFTIELSAQTEPGRPNQLDERFTPPSTAIIGNGGGGSSSSFSGSTSEIKNNIKYNPILLSRSIAALFYERFITEEFSITGGLGYCYGKDNIVLIGSAIDWEIFEGTSRDLSLSDIMTYSKFRSGGNYFGSLALRVYWDTYDDNRYGYLELNARKYNNNLEFKNTQRYDIVDNANVVVTNTTYNIIYGTQFHTNGKIKTVHDFYCGFGIRGTNYDIFKYQTFYNTNGQAEPRLLKTNEREKIYSPMLLLGYAFGFGF
jgi:hypothetical protein